MATRETLVQALLMVHSPGASPMERASAGKFLEDFKQSPEAVDQSLSIFSGSSFAEVQLRHFCLHCVQGALNTQWNGWPQSRKDALKQTIFLFAAKHLDDILSGPKVIRENVSMLLAEMAKREWPQLWPSLSSDILSLISTNYTEATVGIKTLTRLAQDACSSDFNSCMPSKRRNEVLQGINHNLPAIMGALFNVLNQQYALFSQSRGDERARGLLICALECLGVYCEWMPLDVCFEPTRNLLQVFTCLLQDASHPIRMASLKPLYAMCNRKSFTDETANAKMSAKDAFSMVIAACSALPLDAEFPVDEELYAFQKQVAELVTVLGEIHLQVFDASTETAAAYVEVAARLFQHPSLKIAEHIMGAWYYIVERLPGYLTSPAVVNKIVWLAGIYSQKLMRRGSPDDIIETPVSQYGSYDFMEHEDFIHSFGIIRSRTTSAVKAMTVAHPGAMIQFTGELVMETLKNSSQCTTALRDGTPYGTQFSTAYINLEGAMMYLETVLGALTVATTAVNGLPGGGDISVPLHSILQMILDFKTNDPILLSRQLIGLSAFSKGGYFKNHDDLLGFVLEKAFSCAVFVTPLEASQKLPLGELHNDTKSARRKAAVALIKISLNTPGKMLPCFPNVVARVLELIRNNSIMDSEKALLYEMMVIVSNSIVSFDNQLAFIDDMMGEPLSQWTSETSTTLVRSPHELIAMLRTATAEDRWRIYSWLQIFSCVGKRTHAKKDKMSGLKKHSFAHNWQHILPNLFALIKTLHEIWEPGVREPLEKSDMCWLQRIAPIEVRISLGFEDHFMEIPGVHQQGVAAATTGLSAAQKEDSGADLSSFMTHIRREAYELIKIAAMHSASMQDCKIIYLQNPPQYTLGRGGIFDIANLHMIMLQNVFYGMPSMEHRHLKLFIASFFSPFVRTCPLPLANALLFPLLLPFLQHVTQMLNTTWDSWKVDPEQRNPWHFPMGLDPEVKLMVDERMIRDASREYISFLKDIFPPKPVVRVKGTIVKHSVGAPSPYHITPLGEVVFTDVRIKEQVIFTFASSLLWPDGKCLANIIPIIERLLPSLTNALDNHAMVAQIMASALQLLLKNEDHGKTYQNHLLVLVTGIYCRLSFGWISVVEGGGGESHNMAPKSDEARKVLMLIPGVGPADIGELDKKVAAHIHSEKARKSAIQSFLQDCSSRMGRTDENSGESVLIAKQLNIANLPTTPHGFNFAAFGNPRTGSEQALDGVKTLFGE